MLYIKNVISIIGLIIISQTSCATQTDTKAYGNKWNKASSGPCRDVYIEFYSDEEPICPHVGHKEPKMVSHSSPETNYYVCVCKRG